MGITRFGRRLCACLLCLLLGIGGMAPGQAHAAEIEMPEYLIWKHNGVQITVHPMLELLAVIQYLSGYGEALGLISRINTPYTEAVETVFGGFRDHPAVQYVKEAVKRGFSYDAPPTACLYINTDFSISADYEGSHFATFRMEEDIDVFRDMLLQFYTDTDFRSFFLAYQHLYEQIIADYVAQFPAWNMVKAMESYYGKRMASYTIILVPLFHSGGYGPSLQREDGTHVYSIFGPMSTTYDRRPFFGYERQIRALVLHEFGHSFISINDENNAAIQEQVARSEYLMEPIAGEMSAMAYPYWSTAYEELVLRAAVIDIIEQQTGTDPRYALNDEEANGFQYIRAVYDLLGSYATDREQYDTFDDFVPGLTEGLMRVYPAQ